MKKEPRQLSMENWLLDLMHGLNADNDFKTIAPSDFFSIEAFEYGLSIQPKRTKNKLERRIRRVMSRSLWPRILILRLRSVLSTSLALCMDGHWVFLDEVLQFVQSSLHYLGFMTHGLRLTMNLGHLVNLIASSDSVFESLHQTFEHAWLELLNDAEWLVSALTPNYFALSFGFMLFDLSLMATRAWNEEQRLLHHIHSMEKALSKPGLNPEHQHELLKAQAHAELMRHYAHKKLALNLIITLLTTGIFLFKVLVLPLMVSTVNPLTPVVFAVIALAISLANHYLNKALDQSKPKTDMGNLSGKQYFLHNQNTFFKINTSFSDDNALVSISIKE